MSRTRRKIGAALKAKIALEALRDEATSWRCATRFTDADLHELREHAARAFEPGGGGDAEARARKEQSNRSFLLHDQEGKGQPVTIIRARCAVLSMGSTSPAKVAETAGAGEG